MLDRCTGGQMIKEIMNSNGLVRRREGRIKTWEYASRAQKENHMVVLNIRRLHGTQILDVTGLTVVKLMNIASHTNITQNYIIYQLVSLK